ncbi:ligase-associated DNA damage response exonuclease [Prosthecomicrobium hirschii]|uniref:ligase-associated DNA damage response exonuclease n=1 Tax=Prosthecodimorpha hirschii TaxID=665126 RepID=UPI00221F235B|nr:ligase-associated DNA damage response exonuclease [Prosthecomicrobium hirschii]MCW1842957.1 ligase-associated DNA damage response exonuclease [Prosthecomicrobium hirschii]
MPVAADLLTLTPAGLYCPRGGFHIDPVRPVDRALITHGHSDHARSGHGAVLATPETLAIMAVRYGEAFAGTTEAAGLGRPIRIGDIRVTFHPAGHVLGSAQIALEAGGCRIVVSGDYKRQLDPTCSPFETVACDVFVTEATFGLPVFRHPDARGEAEKLIGSLAVFPDRPHLVGAYALGKAQRMIALLREAGYDDTIFLHGALERLCQFYESRGIELGPLDPVRGLKPKDLAGRIVLCPPGSMADLWSRRLGDPVTAFASGWMRVRARARQRGVELPLIVSDHADWDDLTATIEETGAGEVWVTHGAEEALVHWCRLRGLDARPLNLLGYGDEGEAEPESSPAAADSPDAEAGPTGDTGSADDTGAAA